MDNFDKKKRVAELPDTSNYDIYILISMVVLTTKKEIYITEKWF